MVTASLTLEQAGTIVFILKTFTMGKLQIYTKALF